MSVAVWGTNRLVVDVGSPAGSGWAAHERRASTAGRTHEGHGDAGAATNSCKGESGVGRGGKGARKFAGQTAKPAAQTATTEENARAAGTTPSKRSNNPRNTMREAGGVYRWRNLARATAFRGASGGAEAELSGEQPAGADHLRPRPLSAWPAGRGCVAAQAPSATVSPRHPSSHARVN